MREEDEMMEEEFMSDELKQVRVTSSVVRNILLTAAATSSIHTDRRHFTRSKCFDYDHLIACVNS